MATMQSSITKSRFEWCCSPDNAFLELDLARQDVPKTAHRIHEKTGSGWFESMHLPLNMVIRRGTAHFTPEASGTLCPFMTVKEQFQEPVLSLHAPLTGRVILSDFQAGHDFIFDSSNTLFQHSTSRDNEIKLDASNNFDMFTLLVADSVLCELCGEEYRHTLLETLAIAAIPTASIRKVPHRISALLHSSIPDHLTGNISKLHAQAKVLEYLCRLGEYFGATKREVTPASRIQSRITLIHEELCQLEGKVPSLNELAQRYDLPAAVLREEFRKMYGKSLFGYISEVRLNEAHAALLNSAIPMKIIANNLGYSHVNHFISAFGRQFGYSPGSLRKKTEARYDTPLDDPA